MKCDFCGHVFEMSQCKSGCSGCAMSKSCKKIKCPNCNYEMLPTPEFKLFKGFKAFVDGLWKRDRKVFNNSLTGMKVNEKARIVKIKTDDKLKLRKLTAFGILPGSDIIVIQKYPAVVVQVGFTQVALDEDIASEIVVDM